MHTFDKPVEDSYLTDVKQHLATSTISEAHEARIIDGSVDDSML